MRGTIFRQIYLNIGKICKQKVIRNFNHFSEKNDPTALQNNI